MKTAMNRRQFVLGSGALFALSAGLRTSSAQEPLKVPTVDSLVVKVLTDSSYDTPRPVSTKLVKVRRSPFISPTDYRKALHNEWGLALALESRIGADGRLLMLDYGYTPEALLGNMQIMGVDGGKMHALILSHGHFDHFGGLIAFLEKYRAQASPHFDPAVHLARIGVANQTTMLARESLAIGECVGNAMARAKGDAYRAGNFRTFDTICSATQDRQDAVNELLREPLDVMLVIGGYNSSNTISLAALCAERVPTYHVSDAACIDPARGVIRHVLAGGVVEVETRGWLADAGPVRVGLTAGASTPNNKIGETVARVLATRGVDPASVT